MDLVERVENTRFLGREFLVWLWFKSELHEAEFSRADGSPFELWLDSQLGMRYMYEPTERIAFKGVAPAARVEAKLALRHGWLPVKARICVNGSVQIEGKDYTSSYAPVRIGSESTQYLVPRKADTGNTPVYSTCTFIRALARRRHFAVYEYHGTSKYFVPGSNQRLWYIFSLFFMHPWYLNPG